MSTMSFRGELPVREHLRPVPRPLPCRPDEAWYLERNEDRPGYAPGEPFPLCIAAGWPVWGEA
jgi:hypothetical protein